jgi:serine protease Do
MRILFLLIAFMTLLLSSYAAGGKIVPENRDMVQLSFAPLVKKVSPAVVNIYSSRVVKTSVSPFMNDPFFNRFFGNSPAFGGIPQERVQNTLGSGVIVEASGLIVTNAHVVGDADKIVVALPDGREFDAQKALVDHPSDLALLRIDPRGEELPYVEMRHSQTLEVGDLVLAIGNPFGVGRTVTSGIVSAVASSSLNINDFNFFIQTDAAINPGNSGGPLVAMDGSVVGINTAIFSRSGGNIGIGFAVPSEMVATVIAAEKAGIKAGKAGILRPWLGVTGQKITADIADSLDLAAPRGVLISRLHSQSPLKKAGLAVGDVMLSINDKTISDPSEMKFRMATIPLGGEAKIEYLRKGKTKAVTVKAVAPPDDPPRNEKSITGNNPFAGATVSNINPAVSAETGVQEEEGVIVTDVAARAIAARIVQVGDLILSVNGAEIKNVNDLQSAIAAPQPVWQLVISHGGQARQIVIR